MLSSIPPDVKLNTGIVVPPKTVFATTDTGFLRKRRKDLEDALRVAVGSTYIWSRHTAALCKFCEISIYSFSPWLGRKGREGFIRKRNGGHYLTSSMMSPDVFRFASVLQWQTQWLVLKDSAIIYSDSPIGKPRGAILVDRSLTIEIDVNRTIRVSQHEFLLH